MRKYPPLVSRANTTEATVPIIPRRFARVAVDLPARYAIEGQLGWRASMIDDLGGGGVRLQTEDDVAAGTIVVLQFELEGTPISVRARVAMSLYDRTRSRYIHGVAFTAIEPQQRERIVRRVDVLRGEAP